MILDDDDNDDDVILLFWHLARAACVFFVKVKVTLEQAKKAQRGSRGIALLFL
jgi:hypothetical protein